MDDSDDIVLGSEKIAKKSETKRGKTKPKKSDMEKHDNFISMGVEALKNCRWKSYFMLFFIFLILTCDIFNDRCLSQFNGAVDGCDPTTYGSVLQGIFLVIFFVIVDYVVQIGYF